MSLIETILFHSPLCTGCRSCEIACGFHMTGEMDPSRSCLTVEKDSSGHFEMTLHQKCDLCPGLEIPFCLQVCQAGALRLGRKKI